MALLVLQNDITNAHQVDGHAVDALAYDCHYIKRVGGHEAQAIWECRRTLPNGEESTFHIVANRPSFAHETMSIRERKLRDAARKELVR